MEKGSITNEGVLLIPQRSWTGAIAPDGLMSYSEYSFGLAGSYLSPELKSVYLTALAHRTVNVVKSVEL